LCIGWADRAAQHNQRLKKRLGLPASACCERAAAQRFTHELGESTMDTSSVLLIGEAIAGGIGGWITGGSLKSMSLGQVANTIVGLLGGIVLGYWLHAMFPGLTSSVSLGGIVGQIVGAFVGGGVLTLICALFKDLLSPRSVS
jgi:uncharacterized membrane protein YeaQ/YmgE (transglycosylase-associated protein family)